MEKIGVDKGTCVEIEVGVGTIRDTNETTWGNEIFSLEVRIEELEWTKVVWLTKIEGE